MWKNWRERTALDVVDPTLKATSTTEIMQCINIGLLCVQENIADRPTMALVIHMFNSYSISLPIPSRPGIFTHNNVESDLSTNQSIQASANQASITELYPR